MSRFAAQKEPPLLDVESWEFEDADFRAELAGRSGRGIEQAVSILFRPPFVLLVAGLVLFVFAGASSWAYSQSDASDDDIVAAGADWRRLEASESGSGPRCRASAADAAPGLPVRGVRYAPHLVGEPYAHPESQPLDYYQRTYSEMHKRDLPLLGSRVGADTLVLQPWSSAGDHERSEFFGRMREAGICKIIPTFHLAKYYADMLRDGDDKPRTDPSSALAVDFARFGASLDPRLLNGIEAVSWTVDLSLDLKELLPRVGSDCQMSQIGDDPSFQKYMDLLVTLERWVRPGGGLRSVAPQLANIPFLVPLDVSRASWAEPNWRSRLNLFIRCMGTNARLGGWSHLYDGEEGRQRQTRWLFFFALPVDEEATYNFRDQLMNLTQSLSTSNARAIVMVGTQALRGGDANPIDSPNMLEDFGVDEGRYRRPVEVYEQTTAKVPYLDGIVYDEWMDDWDRGFRGPFFLADDTVHSMQARCAKGSRFTHDIDSCTRTVGNGGNAYPEFFGLAAASSQLFRHCVHPRFSQSIFLSALSNTTDMQQPVCVFMRPSMPWMWTATILISLVAYLQVLRMLCVCCQRRSFRESLCDSSCDTEFSDVSLELKVAHLEIIPEDLRLGGHHQIELQSSKVRTHEEAGWWLWMHAGAQMHILERQVHTEARAQLALQGRRNCQVADFDDDTAEDMVAAMQIVHRRVLEGFASWCMYVGAERSRCSGGPSPDELRMCAERIVHNEGRAVGRLFAECLLLRVMESLGEQILQCPERLSYLLFDVLQESGGMFDDSGPITFSINMDKLHDGLYQMSIHSNPYEKKKMPSGRWELGLNFDDINESGIQCRDGVAKTYKEPASTLVLVDFLLCYRVPIMIKVYCLALAGYMFLGSNRGNDVTSSHNGSFFEPKWLRINYLQYTAMMDVAMWIILEVMLIVYVLYQRWPSLGYTSPGIPGLRWLTEHLLNLGFTAAGGFMLLTHHDFRRKPGHCAESDAGDCVDERTDNLVDVLRPALAYWCIRMLLFVILNSKGGAMFLNGTPDAQARKNSGRGRFSQVLLDIRVAFAWFGMLGTCIFAEVMILLPTMKGLDWSTTCGMDILGDISGIPKTQGICTASDQLLSFGCMNCLAGVAGGWSLVVLGSLVDIYFVFYLASAIFGGIMGHSRQLNDLKNTSLPIDLRERQGREAQLFERTFGPGWQQIWRAMVRNLLNESFVSPKQAASLCQAAGVSLDGEMPLTHRDRKQKPIHLARFPDLAAERLAFFFQSLKWIESQRSGDKPFNTDTDSLTGVHFDARSIPSLTQIIPAFNEVVIPTVVFLRAGAEPEDARNGSPDDQPGLGDLTLPPQGDGINTNLAFMISQFPDEWFFLAQRLHSQGWIQSAESRELYHDFMRQSLSDVCVVEVRMWAAMRCQTVAKTVIGALQYGRALATLPKIREHYLHFPEKRVAEDHAEVILAHQTYGHSDGNETNDEAVRLLLEAYADDALFLVFDMQKGTAPDLWQLVNDFLVARGGFTMGAFTQASVKCMWDKARRGLRVLEVLPRQFPLRLGQGDYKTQGKACNQLNGLRFATGHYVQALDCNMGTFMGEAFKVPYVLRMFMPLGQDDRSAPRCRYLGFREYIYTGREGTVGKCHAAAEWTFGTINQRFLSGLGIRMHYGHPDFLDGFWARNRGGMSKSSPVVNLSEDIFAGYNVRLREEASPHIDSLEFEKGREATFNAASNFFSKISGGSIALLRSRDNHLLCERIGIIHSLSFYFSSIAFYMSNLLVDITIQVYVWVFILFTLAGLGPGKLAALGSTFSTEWIVSMGLVTLVPQLCELVLEYGAVHAVKKAIGGLLASTFFFIFQNKNIAEAMREGMRTGIARYAFTGRPSANQHQTWKDIYCSYWKSHYQPAFGLSIGYLIYTTLAMQNEAEGKLPMVLVVTSIIAWVVTPIIFSPFPRWHLIFQDLCEFNSFITSGAGSHEADIQDVIARGKRGTVRSLYETGLADELSTWSDQHFFMLSVKFILHLLSGAVFVVLLPAEILDFLPIFIVLLSLSWVSVLGYFAAGLNNVFLVMSFLLWGAGIPLAHHIIGGRAGSPGPLTRMPEFVISTTVFIFFFSRVKELLLLTCRAVLTLCPCISKSTADTMLHRCVRACFVYFFVQQIHMVEAYIILCANAVTACGLAVVDQAFGNLHTWWLLNRELARTPHGDTYLKKGQAPFFELDRLHIGCDEELFGSDSESEYSGSDARDENFGSSASNIGHVHWNVPHAQV